MTDFPNSTCRFSEGTITFEISCHKGSPVHLFLIQKKDQSKRKCHANDQISDCYCGDVIHNSFKIDHNRSKFFMKL